MSLSLEIPHVLSLKPILDRLKSTEHLTCIRINNLTKAWMSTFTRQFETSILIHWLVFWTNNRKEFWGLSFKIQSSLKQNYYILRISIISRTVFPFTSNGQCKKLLRISLNFINPFFWDRYMTYKNWRGFFDSTFLWRFCCWHVYNRAILCTF